MAVTDTLIVGAGPIGLELAAALKARGIDSLHLDAGQIGHTISWWAPGTRFFSSPERLAIAGVPLVTRDQEKATREEYLAYLRAVAEGLDLRVSTGERVLAIERSAGPDGHDGTAAPFLVRTRRAGRDAVHHARRVVLAIGDMHRPRLLGIPGEGLPHVSHYFAEPHAYFRRRVLIVGGRNSAVEAAVRCARVGAHVTLCHRGDAFDPERIKYWLLPEMEGLIRSGRVAFIPRAVPVEITPTGARLACESTPHERTVEADDALLLTGYEQDPALFRSAGVALRAPELAPIYNPRTMETGVPGLYVAGTAAAGTQRRFTLFIETAHVHASRIARALAGDPAPDPGEEPRPAAAPES